MTRVAIVAGICVEHDAISNAIVSQAQLLSDMPTVSRVDLFAQHIDRALPCRGHVVPDGWDLARHPEYRQANVAIFHWGIHYALFDLVALGGAVGPAVAVHFHNCTPPSLLPEPERVKAEASITQAQLMAVGGVRVWTHSPFNRETLGTWGVAQTKIDDVPLVVERPRALRPQRPEGTVSFLSVGRIVPAKGQNVLIDAVGRLPPDLRRNVRVRIAGNSAFTESGYLDHLRSRVGELGLGDTVEFVGQPDDDGLWRLYETSHAVVSTSLHEGLCVPIIEAYVAGCRAVGTDAGNLPYVVQPPDPIVPAEDPVALAGALVMICDDILSGRASDRTAAHELCGSYSRHATIRKLGEALHRLCDTR